MHKQCQRCNQTQISIDGADVDGIVDEMAKAMKRDVRDAQNKGCTSATAAARTDSTILNTHFKNREFVILVTNLKIVTHQEKVFECV